MPERRRGYAYSVTDDQIRAFRALSTADKLRWLEGVTELIDLADTPRRRAIREAFRRGEI